MSNAVVTILLPIKDPHPKFFKEAIASVRNQTSNAWELILIAEKEEVPILQALIGSFKTQPNISVIKNESYLLSGALNTGMRTAKTSFVCILLGDDLLAPNAIEVLKRNIDSNPAVDFFHSSRRFINEQSDFISKVYLSVEEFKLKDFLEKSPVKHLLCWNREKALAIGGIDENLGLHGADDYDFPWSMAEAGCIFKAIPECLYYYRDHRAHDRLTTHVPLKEQLTELEKIFRKHGMTQVEIDAQLKRRTAGYLKQALFLDEDDRKRKTRSDFDPRSGWREEYQ